jgi:hypothetical protein
MSTATDDAKVEMWDTTEVTLATKKGEVKERGLVHPRAPGLAVTMLHFGTFDVTHLASGKIVAKGFERIGNACAYLAALACCADWTQDAAGLAAQIEAHGAEPANVPRWTVTEGGETRPQTKREVLRSARSHDFYDEFPWESEEDDPMEHAGATLKTLPRAAS